MEERTYEPQLIGDLLPQWRRTVVCAPEQYDQVSADVATNGLAWITVIPSALVPEGTVWLINEDASC